MTYRYQTEESELKILPIEQAVDSEAMLRHVRTLIDQELDYRREVTRYEMGGRTYLRIRLPECDCEKRKHEKKPKTPHKLTQAMAFLENVLADGPIPMKSVIDHGLSLGLSVGTLVRAKKAGIAKSRKVGDVWYWELIEEEVAAA
jgi:hypothetical protein